MAHGTTGDNVAAHYGNRWSAERGWMVPAYTLPPNAQDVKIVRALVEETLSREMVVTLAGDVADACRTLEEKGGTHRTERER